MSEALAPITGYSLGERLYDTMSVSQQGAFEGGLWDAFPTLPPSVQAFYETAATIFVSRLTYAETVGVREALLSSVLLSALKDLVGEASLLHQNAIACAANHYGENPESDGLPGWLADGQAKIEAARAAIAQADSLANREASPLTEKMED